MIAVVPSCSGAKSLSTAIVICAWLSFVRSILRTEPMRHPPTCTSSSLTSWPAFWKSSSYLCPPPPERSTTTTTTSATANAPKARARAEVKWGCSPGSGTKGCGEAGEPGGSRGYVLSPCLAGSLHAKGTLRLAGEELTHERIVGVEQLVRGPGLDDAALPQDGDVLRDAPRAHDVVGDDDVRAAVLLVDLLDELAQERGAHGVEAGVGLVEEHDVGVEDERAGEAGALAHAARQLVGHLVDGLGQAHLAQAAVDDVADLVLALVGVLAQREGDVVVEVHRAEQRAVLEEDAELLAHLEQLGVLHVRHRLAVDEDVALVGIQQADHVLDAHRLPRARRAEDHRDLVVGQAHVQAAQDLVAAEGLVHVDELHRVAGAVRALLLAGVPLELVVLAVLARVAALADDGHARGVDLLVGLLVGGLLVPRRGLVAHLGGLLGRRVGLVGLLAVVLLAHGDLSLRLVLVDWPPRRPGSPTCR